MRSVDDAIARKVAHVRGWLESYGERLRNYREPFEGIVSRADKPLCMDSMYYYLFLTVKFSNDENFVGYDGLSWDIRDKTFVHLSGEAHGEDYYSWSGTVVTEMSEAQIRSIYAAWREMAVALAQMRIRVDALQHPVGV